MTRGRSVRTALFQHARSLVHRLPQPLQRAIRGVRGTISDGLRALVSERQDPLDRHGIGMLYLRGDGIEIGALHSPVRVPEAARVKYVDRYATDQLRRRYPELESHPFVDVDIVDDGERLTSIGDASQDFVIANHFVEHCQDPVGALLNMLRVLKDDGILYLALPDKRFTFDVNRPITPLAHVLRDYQEGPGWSHRQHYEEWVNLVDKIQDPDKAEHRITGLIHRNHSIHFHVWTQTEMLEMVQALRTMVALDVELFYKVGAEVIIILRKVRGSGGTSPPEAPPRSA